MTRIVTFGEIMGRLTPPGMLRLRQALPGLLEVTFAGAEANVAASLALLGAESCFVSVLPDNVLGDSCLVALRSLGIDTSCMLRTARGRLGLYLLETGANQRPSQVIYDRMGSAISLASSDRYDWGNILDGADWFHVTGITPAISRSAAESTLTAVSTAKRMELTVSCDLNYRQKLWRWDESVPPRELAEKTMREILPHVDLLIANEADGGDVLGIQAAGSDVEAGKLQVDRYPEVARQAAKQFPNLSAVAITLRGSISASHNTWGGLLYRTADDAFYLAPVDDQGVFAPYDITHIVDRVGTGDAFAAALIFAITTPELSHPAEAIRFATAAACLAHSIVGDFNFATRGEIEALMQGAASGRVVR